ncbi:putative enhancer of mRNA-decapping protein 4 [Apostichopus japonicus]|uniref:Putative enhancer of mRNA-decapping protein 4 n=1 Tax=Stichopus japonicus TaxID=307972 RepID=A0A2G8LCP1_STIJA|nr:putative enhancer of mRNA-decapping protein 4 [Apostichopus japonicus]
MNQEVIPQLGAVRTNIKQNVVLHGDDSRASFPLYGQEVIITPSGNSNVNNAATASSQVKCTPVVKYDWGSKYYVGNMLAVNKQYVVYVLKMQTGYGVRVLNRQTSQRALLKGFKEMINDLAFSHYNSNLLACVDRIGSLSVWKLMEEDDHTITSKLILSVNGESTHPSDTIGWSGAYLPEDPSSGEPEGSYSESHMILRLVELWDIEEDFLEGVASPVSKEGISGSFILVPNGHDSEITDLAVAPDGSVMATASLDGTVKFWEMIWESTDPPRRLHGSNPTMTNRIHVAFWRFLLTGADFNSEIKLWCTVSWKCLQVVRFLTPDPQPCLKVCLDQSASFLMATDMKRKPILRLCRSFLCTKPIPRHTQGQSHFSSLSEFVLNEPMLNFCVATAGQIGSKPGEEEDGEEAQLSGEFSDVGTSIDNHSAADVSVLVKIFCVFSSDDLQKWKGNKKLDSKHLNHIGQFYDHPYDAPFQPVRHHLSVGFAGVTGPFLPISSVDNDVPCASVSTTSREDIALRDGLSDVSFSAAEQSTDAEGSQPDLIGGISPARSDLQPTPAQSMTSSFTSESIQSPLITPDALRSGSFNQKDLGTLQQLRDSTSSSASSFTQVTRTNMSTVEDIMSPQSPSTGDGSLTVTPSSLQEPSPNSSRVLTPSQVPLPPSASGSRDTSLRAEEEEDDNAPRSPPTPGGRRPREPQPRRRGRTDPAERRRPGRGGSGATRTDKRTTTTPVGPPTIPKAEVKVGALVDLSYSPIVTSVGSGTSRRYEREVERQNVGEDEEEETKEVAESEWQSSDGRMPNDEREDHEAQEGTPNIPVHPTVATVKQTDNIESSSATGSESETASGDARRESRRRRARGSHSELDNQTAGEMQEIKALLSKVMAAFEHQQDDMTKLRQDITKSQQSNSIIQSMKSRIEKLEKNINTKVDTLVTEHAKGERQRLDTLLQDRQRTDKQRQEQLLETVKTTVKQMVNQSVTQNLGKTIQKEVMPEISESLSGLTTQLSQIAAEKMTTTDQQLRENISKLIKNRNFGDNIAQSAAQVMAGTITQSYRDNFFKNVIPAFDNACKNMFQQMAVSFQAGTDQCIQQMQTTSKEHTVSIKQESEVVIAEMRSLGDSQQNELRNLRIEIEKSLQKSISQQLQTQTERMERNLAGHLQQLIVTEIQPVLKKHQDSVHESIVSVVRSQAATPVPQQPDIERTEIQIMELLRRKKINDAFQVALNAADLRALMFACKKVEMELVFGEECALEQPVLLSLIHQLSHDLSTDTELKTSCLEDCIVAINVESEVTKGHLPSILEDLIVNISGYIQNPACTPELMKRLKRVSKQAMRMR